MNDVSATAWIGIIVAVLAALAGIVAWAYAARRRHPVSGLSAELLDQHLGLAAAGESAAMVAYLNIRLTNHGQKTVVVDGLGYRRQGSRRLVPIRNYDAPTSSALTESTDALLAPPYRLAAGESRTITLFAPALCAPEDLAGIYLHTDDGELVWLPPVQLNNLTRGCTWVSDATKAQG